MNEVIKKILNCIMGIITWCLNRGQVLICRRERVKMWIPEAKDKNFDVSGFHKNREYLRKFGFVAKKGDYKVFSPYLQEKGKDPRFIVPQYVVHNYLTALLNPIPYDAYFSDKNMFDKILPREFLPKTYFRRMGGIWYDAEYNPVHWEYVKRLLNKGDGIGSIVVKPSKDASSGKGVKLFEYRSGKWESFEGDTTLWKMLEENYWGHDDLIFQEVVEQNEVLSQFCDTSVNTLRIVIYNSPIDGQPHYIWSGLRIGKRGSVVDNNHAGGLMFGVSPDGKIACYGATQFGEKRIHFNGVDFSSCSFFIDNFPNILEFAKEMAIKLIPNRFIAFDISLDKNYKPIVIEYNLRGYGGWACQFAGDYMFGDKTDEILKYLQDNRKKVKKVFYKVS